MDEESDKWELLQARRRRKQQQSARDALQREEERKLVQEYLAYLQQKKFQQQQQRQQLLCRVRAKPQTAEKAENAGPGPRRRSRRPRSRSCRPCGRSRGCGFRGRGKRRKSCRECYFSTCRRRIPKTHLPKALYRLKTNSCRRTPLRRRVAFPEAEAEFPPNTNCGVEFSKPRSIEELRIRVPRSRVPSRTRENVATLYGKFKGPLMLKYLKELEASDKVTAWRLNEILSLPNEAECESERTDRDKGQRWSQHLARKQRLRLMHQVATEVLKGKKEMSNCFQDAPFAAHTRTVNWYNKHGNLSDQIRLNQVAGVLSEIKPNQAMKILYDLDTAKETLPDPTGWIIAEARKRRQLNDKGKGDGKGDDKYDKEKGNNSNNKGDGKAEAKPKETLEWRSQEPVEKGQGKGKGAGKGKDEKEEEETDEFRAKMRRTINWYNRHGHLLAPIRFQEVITTLGTTDPRVAMRILNDLDQANAEAVLSDPTKWIIEDLSDRFYVPRLLQPFVASGRQWPPVPCNVLPYKRLAQSKSGVLLGSRDKSVYLFTEKDLKDCSGLPGISLPLNQGLISITYGMLALPDGSLALARSRNTLSIVSPQAISTGGHTVHNLYGPSATGYGFSALLLLDSEELMVGTQDGHVSLLSSYQNVGSENFRQVVKLRMSVRILEQLPDKRVIVKSSDLDIFSLERKGGQTVDMHFQGRFKTEMVQGAKVLKGHFVVLSRFYLEIYRLQDLDDISLKPPTPVKVLPSLGGLTIAATMDGFATATARRIYIYDMLTVMGEPDNPGDPGEVVPRVLQSDGWITCLCSKSDGVLVAAGHAIYVYSLEAQRSGGYPDFELTVSSPAHHVVALPSGALAVGTSVGGVDLYLETIPMHPLPASFVQLPAAVSSLHIPSHGGMVAVTERGISFFSQRQLVGGDLGHAYEWGERLSMNAAELAPTDNHVAVGIGVPDWTVGEDFAGYVLVFETSPNLAQLIGNLSLTKPTALGRVDGCLVVATSRFVFDGTLVIYRLEDIIAHAEPYMSVTAKSRVFALDPAGQNPGGPPREFLGALHSRGGLPGQCGGYGPSLLARHH
ncbi:unnamed protein product [Effrenium voratum]|nr:unnamed protein product [Effrenium voratum]